MMIRFEPDVVSPSPCDRTPGHVLEGDCGGRVTTGLTQCWYRTIGGISTRSEAVPLGDGTTHDRAVGSRYGCFWF